MKTIQLSGLRTKEILISLIFNKFHDCNEFEEEKQLELIEVAKKYDLNELAEQLVKDLKY
jgi:hypothetical protein